MGGIQRATNASRQQQSGGSGPSITPAPVASVPGATSCDISWPSVSGATGYRVYTGPSASGPWTLKGSPTTATYNLTGLSAVTTTWCGIEAVVVSPKGVVSFVTAAAPTSFSVLESSGAGAHHTLSSVSDILTPHGQSGNVLTSTTEIVNDTGVAQDSIAVAVASGAEVSGLMRFQVRMGGNPNDQTGTWYDILWDGAQTKRVVKVPVFWSSGDEPSLARFEEASQRILPLQLAPEALVTVRAVCSTSVAGEMVPISDDIAPSAWDVTNNQLSRIGAGDAINGTLGATFTQQQPIGLAKIIWGRTAAENIKETVFFGDSTFEMFAGGGPSRRGWLYFANQMARDGNKLWRVTGLGISSNEMGMIELRALAAIPWLAATGRKMAFQVMSWNSRSDYGASVAIVANVKAACDAAGVGFIPCLVSPPGTEVFGQANPWAHPQPQGQLDAYTATLAILQATYATFLDLRSGIISGTDYIQDVNNSRDNVHGEFGDSVSQLGQYRIAMNLYAAMDAIMAALG